MPDSILKRLFELAKILEDTDEFWSSADVCYDAVAHIQVMRANAKAAKDEMAKINTNLPGHFYTILEAKEKTSSLLDGIIKI